MNDPYCYPESTVLKNKLDMRDSDELARVERMFAVQRAREGAPDGDFDLFHLKAIHRHLFQDIYDWAGKTRTIEISKGGSQFQFHRYIATGMADVHRRILGKNYLKDLSPGAFAEAAGAIIGDVNYVHPFREGNGRAQALFLQRLAANAGHELDLKSIDKTQWTAASKAAHFGDYAPMGACIRGALPES